MTHTAASGIAAFTFEMGVLKRLRRAVCGRSVMRVSCESCHSAR